MQVDLKKFFNHGDTVAVAVSGGSDSMSLLYYMLENSHLYHLNIVAINIEHGIRGESSVSDSMFVKNYCETHGIPIYTFTVDSLKKAEQDKISIEQAARILRYECFQKLLADGKCDKIATAHHLSDNTESVLFNLFRGTGPSGLTGIKAVREDKIVRPFVNISKEEIDKYVESNQIPFVTDETNLSTEYTRNFIRHKIVPKIKKIFPEFDHSIKRLSDITAQENAYLDEQAEQMVKSTDFGAIITLPCHPVLLARATIVALKGLGISKDWEKIHVDEVVALANKDNGAKLNLPKNITAFKEYDKISFSKATLVIEKEIPFALGQFNFNGIKINIQQEKTENINLTEGLFADYSKIPKTATIRTKRECDLFTKFGGGTKSLGDYLTDKKIPQRLRNSLPLIADGKEILVIIGVAVSDNVKVDNTTEKILSFTSEKPL